jgi:hypothetical protein
MAMECRPLPFLRDVGVVLCTFSNIPAFGISRSSELSIPAGGTVRHAKRYDPSIAVHINHPSSTPLLLQGMAGRRVGPVLYGLCGHFYGTRISKDQTLWLTFDVRGSTPHDILQSPAINISLTSLS